MLTLTYTPDEIKKMKYNNLIGLAQSLSIPFKSQKKEELQDQVISKLASATPGDTPVEKPGDDDKHLDQASDKKKLTEGKKSKASTKPAKKSATKAAATKTAKKKSAVTPKVKAKIELTKEQDEILHHKDYTKSEKMRRLFKRKMSIANIATLLKAHYSFVYGVIDRYKDAIDTEKK